MEYLHGLGNVAQWEPYGLYCLAHVSSVGSVLCRFRSSTTPHNGRYRVCAVDDPDRGVSEVNIHSLPDSIHSQPRLHVVIPCTRIRQYIMRSRQVCGATERDVQPSQRIHLLSLSSLITAAPKPTILATYDLCYDSPPPPQNRRFCLTNVLWLLGTRKDALIRASSAIFLFAKVCRTMASGWREALFSRRYGRELVSKPRNFVKEKFGGGATAERLPNGSMF